MEAVELIKKESHEVRRNPNLMTLYISYFKQYFGSEPACAGCTFANDWLKFIRAVQGGANPKTTNVKINSMENTFKLKKTEGKILAYRANGKKHRLYDNRLTEDFVTAYLTNGTEEEIQERKKLFAVLPESMREKKDEAPAQEPEAKIEAEAKEKPTKKTRKKRGNNKK